jgi:arylsulfatase A-like enzyme
MTSIRLNPFCRALVWLAVLLAFSAQAEISFILTNNMSAPLPRRASIILIVADGLGYGELSCYGQTKFQTPNLDRLAAEGIRFTNYYAGDAASSPARAALLVGKDAAHLPQRADADVPLAADEMTVAQVLKRSGYHTGWIGAWNLGDENSTGAPWRKGFDEFAGYFNPADVDNHYADYLWRYIPNATNGVKEIFAGKASVYVNTSGQKNQYIPDLYTKAALNFAINNLPDQFNRYRPFFLVLNYHLPQTKNPGQVPTDAPFSGEAWPQPEKNRAAMIARLDDYVGQLQRQLQKLGMTNNVALFFTSDRPPEKVGGMDPQFFQGDVSTNDLRVPMIVRWPGKIPAGQTSGFAWTASDFLPTATDIALVQPPEKIDGVSVLRVLSGQTQPVQHEFLKQ